MTPAEREQATQEWDAHFGTTPPTDAELEAQYEASGIVLCERCWERPAYQSHDDGECDHCHAQQMDRAYDRMRERE